MAEGTDTVQLVADVQNTATPGRELAQGIEQFAHRLRRQDRRWLVQYQQLRLAQQRPDDLYPLAFAHRQGMDVALRFKIQAVLCSRVGDAPLELLNARTAGQAQRD